MSTHAPQTSAQFRCTRCVRSLSLSISQFPCMSHIPIPHRARLPVPINQRPNGNWKGILRKPSIRIGKCSQNRMPNGCLCASSVFNASSTSSKSTPYYTEPREYPMREAHRAPCHSVSMYASPPFETILFLELLRLARLDVVPFNKLTTLSQKLLVN